MLLNISRYLSYYLLKKEIIEDEKVDVIIYGLQLILSTISSAVTILLLSSVINIAYGIIFLLFFMPIRFCAGGYHAKAFNKCFIYTNCSFIITILITTFIYYYILPIYLLFPLTLAGIVYLSYKAPCKNLNNLLSDIYCKKNNFNSRIILMVYGLGIIITYQINLFVFLLELNTLFLVSILFIIGNLENKKSNTF